jgi:hypothetical protein
MKKWLLYICTCFIVMQAHAQISFTIKTASRTIGKNENLQVEYTVANADELSDYKDPIFKDWNVLSGPMYSQQQLITNGKVEKSTSYIYILQPKHSGTLSLPATTVITGGRKLICNPVNITVTNSNVKQQQQQSTLPDLFEDVPAYEPEDHLTMRPGESVENKIRQMVFIRAEPNKTTCYAGEPILVTYKLYTALRPDLQVSKQPSFTGCSIIELPFDDFPVTEELNGKNYRVYTFRKVQLTPLQAGSLTLEPAAVKATLTYLTANNGRSGNSTVEIKNVPLLIKVNPLPLLNGKEFDGPVGQFTLLLKADNDTIAAGATDNLIVELNGAGNFRNVRTPEIQWPANTQHFDETSSEELDKKQYPVGGARQIKIPFVAEKTGEVNFTPVSITYFDPVAKNFMTITSNTLKIVVTNAITTKSIIAENRSLSPNKYLWLIPAIALIVGFVFIITNKKQRKTVVVKQAVAEPVVVAPVAIPKSEIIKTDLRNLSAATNDPELLNACKQVLKEAVHEYGKEISTHEYVILEQLHKDDAVAHQQYVDTMKHINEVLYAPIKMDVNREELISTTRSIVEKLIV